MEVNLPEALVLAIGFDKLNYLGINEEDLTWKRYVNLNLSRRTLVDVKKLRELCVPFASVRGANVVLKDIDTWLSACDRPGQQTARKVSHFCDLLTKYVLHAPGHRLFRKNDTDGEAWLCYYISEIEYHRAETGSYAHPAYAEMEFFFEEFGVVKKAVHSFYIEDIWNMTVQETLAKAGFYAETQELRKNYLNEIKRYRSLVPLIGKQFSVSGMGSDYLGEDESGYRHRNRGTVPFSNDDKRKNRVVIDVFKEDGDGTDRSRHRLEPPNEYFWTRVIEDEKERLNKKNDDPTRKDKDKHGHDRDGLPSEDLMTEPAVIEVPVHPFLIVFDLNKHERISVHVNYLHEYEYDADLMDKLILPENLKSLIKMLVEHKQSTFRDIVSGKGGGAIILLTGAPGVGKTLTAEVYAETEKKPLYSVQASQLGTSPKELEEELMKVLGRAARWKAILLIDEADVYVHERGSDLIQNAIVGVFLRVLEYHASVLFLTTNRADLVDDAIASRCVARIDYKYPTEEDQRKIWRVLADASGVKISSETIKAFAEKHPKISGRDVKNLIKLAGLISSVEGKPIDVSVLEYVMQFKPTVVREGYEAEIKEKGR